MGIQEQSHFTQKLYRSTQNEHRVCKSEKRAKPHHKKMVQRYKLERRDEKKGEIESAHSHTQYIGMNVRTTMHYRLHMTQSMCLILRFLVGHIAHNGFQTIFERNFDYNVIHEDFYVQNDLVAKSVFDYKSKAKHDMHLRKRDQE